ILDDLMRLLALDIGDEADTAGILLEREIVETFGGRTPAMLKRAKLTVGRLRVRGRRQHFCHDVFALEFRPAHVTSFRASCGGFDIRFGLTASRHSECVKSKLHQVLCMLMSLRFLTFASQTAATARER